MEKHSIQSENIYHLFKVKISKSYYDIENGIKVI